MRASSSKAPGSIPDWISKPLDRLVCLCDFSSPANTCVARHRHSDRRESAWLVVLHQDRIGVSAREQDWRRQIRDLTIFGSRLQRVAWSLYLPGLRDRLASDARPSHTNRAHPGNQTRNPRPHEIPTSLQPRRARLPHQHNMSEHDKHCNDQRHRSGLESLGITRQ